MLVSRRTVMTSFLYKEGEGLIYMSVRNFPKHRKLLLCNKPNFNFFPMASSNEDTWVFTVVFICCSIMSPVSMGMFCDD